MDGKPPKRYPHRSSRLLLSLAGFVAVDLAILLGYYLLRLGICPERAELVDQAAWLLQVLFGASLMAMGIAIAMRCIALFPGPKRISFMAGVILVAAPLALTAVTLTARPANATVVRIQSLFGEREFEGIHLPGANLRGINLSCVHLIGAGLGGGNLSDAILSGANLGGANLDGADLTYAELGGANLVGANLDRAVLTLADLSLADLREAKVTEEQLAQADSLEGATMPDGTIHE
jgi:hypothetical protein